MGMREWIDRLLARGAAKHTDDAPVDYQRLLDHMERQGFTDVQIGGSIAKQLVFLFRRDGELLARFEDGHETAFSSMKDFSAFASENEIVAISGMEPISVARSTVDMLSD